ncbi:male sterility protein-domain-containing protein [Dactylonectria estremocensis]|uniref:Male sterility protein-domain-containing protein n=1 Tax=Dactylonectria estremocensis TaxID=1079267 RepID=A0A9P9ENB6_9HYPO|nr:male sterility protein-domain-containing protein [Dactylonectria estremocensis]
MQGSRVGLGTGYGQTKWVSERLVREAGKRGLRGAVVRPGYILGSRNGGVSNTDDFLIRFCKGCVQLGARPRIVNSVNTVPVEHVSWVVLEEFVSAGSVKKDQEQSALMPLFHLATSDLPSTTRAPELDDRNAIAVLKADGDRWTGVDDSAGEGITREDIGSYLRFLAEIKFMLWPTGRGRELPPIAADVSQAQAQWGGEAVVVRLTCNLMLGSRKHRKVIYHIGV